MKRFLRSCIAAFFCLVTIPSPTPARAASELEQHLRDEYKGKHFVVRNFYSGKRLKYDSAGALIDSEPSGDWTLDGFVYVDDVRLSSGKLVVHCKRSVVTAISKGFQFGDSSTEGKKGKRSLHIEAELPGANSSSDLIASVLSRVFLTENDSLAELVPDYWKACVSAGLRGADPACRFAPEFLSVPGLKVSPDSSVGRESTRQDRSASTTGAVLKVGNGVTSPRIIGQHEPDFSTAAREAKYQGGMTLLLTVDSSGVPTNIRIARPIGYGLDEQAVRAVEHWQFEPAKKDGQPVAVEIAVEVDFHLY
ncbi:MAG TPA: energy transducer TonB [Candidatus Sulfotelmatobacter sp.]|nr:energy transducer TonB [Candidatus Sulfotelmatobacter sp.]